MTGPREIVRGARPSPSQALSTLKGCRTRFTRRRWPRNGLPHARSVRAERHACARVDLLCSGCNTVVPVDPTGVEAEIMQLAEELKFRVDTDTLEFAGLCESCQAHNAARGQQTPARRGATRRA